MELKSSFVSDLNNEKRLAVLLDKYYKKYLKKYYFKRVSTGIEQRKGVDVKFIHKKTKQEFLIDEKAQLDYLNNNLPTFAFEIYYTKGECDKPGWLFDPLKITEFYSLITGIYEEEKEFAFCNITFVNRNKLICFLKDLGITKKSLLEIFNSAGREHGKIKVDFLNEKNEGYLFYSKSNKAERPLNLILKLDWLVRSGVAKRLV
jgi:hypothetical protein